MGPASKSSPVARKFQLTFVLFLCIFTLFFHQKLTVNSQVSEAPRHYQIDVASIPAGENEIGPAFAETSADLSSPHMTSGVPINAESSNSVYQKVRTDINVSPVTPVTRELNELLSLTDESDSVWTYRCDRHQGCLRDLRKPGEESVQIDVCWLNCGIHGGLWPYPNQKQTNFGSCLIRFQSTDSISIIKSGDAFSDSKTEEIFSEMQMIFLHQIQQMGSGSSTNSKQPQMSPKATISLTVTVDKEENTLTLDTNEGYSLLVTSGESSCKNDSSPGKVEIEISAETVFGARHALETLSQLITYDFNNKCYKIVNEVSIKDTPAFPYRGLLIDTARNFIAIPHLKRMIDAMSYNKLNMMHWHLSDSNSFPFYSKSVPQMTKYGAYSKAKVYHPEEIQSLVKYALVRGIKIIPELDAPAHAGNGWQWGKLEGLGDLAVCVNAQPWRQFCGQPPCGQLNPLNNNTFHILEKLYSDMLEVFENFEIFHMGGDEVYQDCWNSDPSIISLSATSFKELWGNFQQKAYEKLKTANKMKSIRPIIWTSGLLAEARDRKRLDPSTYIIQVWETASSQLISTLLKENYQLIMSPVDSMYLDQGGGTWLGRDHIYEYKNWQILYDTRISRSGAARNQVLGGEGTLWSEKVNANNMDARMWPRGAAIAERLWSSPQSRSTSVYSRLNHHNERMIRRGIRAEAIQPESCYRIEGHCDDNTSRL